MAAGKRSDPTKLAKEREEIARSMEEMSKPRESTMSLIGKSIMQGVHEVQDRIARRRRRRQGYGSPPQVRGAMQWGFKKERGDA